MKEMNIKKKKDGREHKKHNPFTITPKNKRKHNKLQCLWKQGISTLLPETNKNTKGHHLTILLCTSLLCFLSLKFFFSVSSSIWPTEFLTKSDSSR